MHALGPAGLDRARQARPGQRFPDQPGRGHCLPELARSRRAGVEHQAGGPAGCPAVPSVTWYSTARWLASQISVGLSSHSAYRTSRCEDSARTVTVLVHGGA